MLAPTVRQQAPHRGAVATRAEARTVSKVAGPPGAFEQGQAAASRQKLFNNIAPVYDELNDRLSFGQHQVWKRMAVKWATVKPGDRALDVCCGSGDLAFLLAQKAGPRGAVTGLDFAQEMLDDAAGRARRDAWRSGRLAPISWVQGDALELPFEAQYFDAATMGYGLRNVADIPKALTELHRVLKPGGRVAILDFNNSQDPLIDAIQATFLDRLVIPAAREYGLEAEYEYLRPSIKAFPTGSQQQALAVSAGFSKAVYYEISFGLMGILVATK